MRQFSDDEQGFIPAELQVKKKNATQNIIKKEQQIKNQQQNQKRVLYRFSDGFIKKQPQQAYYTPFTLPIEPLTNNSQLQRKQKSKNAYQTPFKEYCSDEAYSLCYCRQSSQPFFQQRHYIKNEVSLLNIQDKNSPSVKELKNFQLQEKHYSDDTLEFDSKFQSGNLHCAFRRRGTNEYHLFISNDTNSLGYNQWFYFSLRNMMKGVKYVFRIVNYKKMLDFYRNGQRIAIFSMKQSQHSSSGWRWGGNNINFQESSIRASLQARMYTLRFQIQPKYHHDYLLVASTIPYSYSRLLYDIRQLQNEYSKLENASFKTNSVCTTICGNQVPQIVITGTKGDRKEKDKKIIIILARQHPGEVWSSYMVLGVMKGLMKPTPEINYLLENCMFLIYPMINVDGVIYGNFRCDVTGVDLNRRWKQPSKIFHTQIYEIKKKIQQVAKKFRVQTCFDFHGHSKKYNIFCYSCKQNSYTCRILPYLISSHNHLFHIPSCTFGISKDKQSTARATISKILRSQSVLTIQTSNFGERMQLHAKQFQPADINRMGDAILLALRYFSDKKSPAFQQSQKHIRQNYQQFINYDKQNEQESGSDSQPELDEIDFKIKLNTIFDRKYNNQSKSFAKETCNQAHIHKSDVIYKDQKGLNLEEMGRNMGDEANKLDSYPFAIRKNTAKNQQRRHHSKTRTFKASELEQEQSQSIQPNLSQKMAKQMQIKSHQTVDKNSTTKQTLKSIIIRDKKRFSVLHDPLVQKRQTSTINIAQTDTYRSKQFKQIKNQQENRRSIQDFVMKYQRFIPASLVHRGRGRLDVLQEGLNHDDGQFQLNIMLQNKRRIELEKLKLRIEESTDIAERQGKIKWNSGKKDPIVDYRRFKKNQKMRLQVKRLGELSERYLQGHH